MPPAGHPVRRTGALLAIMLAAQGGSPRYAAPMFGCAAFREEVRTTIRSSSGSVTRDESAGRDGVLLLRATPSDSGLRITAWYDSLTVWRQSPEGRDAPDAEGLLGGRWIGTLTPDGRYTADQVPFVPDDVADVADLRGELGDFFPAMTGTGFRVASAREGKYAWSFKRRADTAGTFRDTLEVPMRRDISEEGTLTWDATLGPAGWERTVTVVGTIDAKGAIRRGIRSVVTQRIRVTRLAARSCE